MLARSIILLPTLAWQLRRRGLQRVQSRLAARLPPAPGDSAALAAHDRLAAARRCALIIDLAARRGLWRANCLQRSVAVWYLLARRGLATEIRIGARRDAATGAPAFHAWVEMNGAVVNDAADIRERFTPFDRPIAPGSAAFD